MLRPRLVLETSPSWTLDSLERLYRNLTVPLLHLHWRLDARLPADFFASALALQKDRLRQLDVTQTLEAELSSIQPRWVQGSGGPPVVGLMVRVGPSEIDEANRLSKLDVPIIGVLRVTGDLPVDTEELWSSWHRSRIDTWDLDLAELAPDRRRLTLERLHQRIFHRPPKVRIQPLEAFSELIRHYEDPKSPPRYFDRRAVDLEYEVDRDGRLFGHSVFDTPLDRILGSPEHQRSIETSERAMRAVCGGCPFYGSCSGRPIAEAALAEREPLVCSVWRPMLDLLRETSSAHRPDRPLSPRLQPGVRLRFEGRSDRLALSSGTSAPEGELPRYHVGALVPREPWRPPSEEELEILRSRPADPWRRNRDAAVIELPKSATKSLTEICFACAGATIFAPHEHPGWGDALKRLCAHLRSFLGEGLGIDSVVCYRAPAGAKTVTRVDRGQSCRDVLVGLHLDSWEGTSLRKRQRIRNRLCINLGRSTRYLLYLNRTLDQILSDLGLKECEDVDAISLFAGHDFLRRNPSYPVVRVALHPGEAYIAPTGNMLHDGASPNGDDDFALHLLGRFQVAGAHEFEPPKQTDLLGLEEL